MSFYSCLFLVLLRVVAQKPLHSVCKYTTWPRRDGPSTCWTTHKGHYDVPSASDLGHNLKIKSLDGDYKTMQRHDDRKRFINTLRATRYLIFRLYIRLKMLKVISLTVICIKYLLAVVIIISNSCVVGGRAAKLCTITNMFTLFNL